MTNDFDRYVVEEAVRLGPGEECVIRIQQPPDGPRRLYINGREATLEKSPMIGGQRWGGG